VPDGAAQYLIRTECRLMTYLVFIPLCQTNGPSRLPRAGHRSELFDFHDEICEGGLSGARDDNGHHLLVRKGWPRPYRRIFCHRAFLRAAPWPPTGQQMWCEFDSHSSRSGLGRDAKVTSNRCPSTRPWYFSRHAPCKPVDRPPSKLISWIIRHDTFGRCVSFADGGWHVGQDDHPSGFI
jgi:hypothetical protein